MLARLFLIAALAACSRTETARPEPGPHKIEVRHAPTGDASLVIKKARDDARAGHRKMVVYIGATWCEPCQRFHHAVEKGELDKDFPDLTLLEFDLDKDGVRLGMAGYQPDLIPYFGIPDEDGRATKQSFGGSVKGGSAVEDIAPRLKSLIGS